MNHEHARRSDAPDPLSNYEPPKFHDPVQRLLAEECVDAIECRPYLAVEPTTSVREAVAKLYDSHVSSLLVVHNDRLIGIFTERDVLEKVVECYDRIAGKPVEQFMTTEPTIVYSSDPSAAAVAAIAVAGHRHVPVLDMEEKVYGVASPRRVFQFLSGAS